MRTSLVEIQNAEQFLKGKMEAGDAAVFEVRTLVDEAMRNKVRWQQKVYKLLRLYHLRVLKQDIKVVEQQLFTNPEHAGFARRMELLFKK